MTCKIICVCVSWSMKGTIHGMQPPRTQNKHKKKKLKDKPVWQDCKYES